MNRRFLALGTAMVGLSVLLTLSPAAAANPSLTYVPTPLWWGTNGRVVDILPAGNRVYLAGGFDYVGPTTGYGVGVDAASGTRLADAPLVDGPVRAAAPDGQGGWYIAGDFTYVGGTYRKRAAQITASGQVTSWNPRPNATVRALVVAGGSVFLGGDFTSLAGTPVTRLGAVKTSDGAAVPGWSASADGSIRSVVAAGGAVYVAGAFSHINDSAHEGVVRLSAATGALDPGFGGQTSGAVNAAALSPDGDTLYVGGDFSAAGIGSSFQSRSRLAAFSTSNGAVTAWAPGANGSVLALATNPANGNVYAGGLFDAAGGAARARLAGFAPAGGLLGFDAGLNGCNTRHTTKEAHTNAACTPEVDALAAADGMLYVGGRFGQSFGTRRHDAAAFSLANGGLGGWDPVPSDRVLTVAAPGGNVFVGGELTSINGAVRQGIAALDARTGAVDPSFNADANDMVLDLALSPDGSRLYLAGHFTAVRDKSRYHLASVQTTDGSPDLAFHPKFNNDVLALAVGNGSLYVGGQFKRIGQQARGHTAKLSLSTGALDTAFAANTSGPGGPLRAYGMVQTLQVAPDGSKVYLGGPFETVNAAQRRGIAVVNGLTGALLGNQLGGVQSCQPGNDWIVKLSLSSDGKRLYGGDLCPDYVYQWDAVKLSSPSNPTGLTWKTLCNAGMQGALEVNGHFYYGTHGGNQGSGGRCWASPSGGPNVSQQRYFVFDAASGALLPDNPSFDAPMGVWSFAALPGGLLVGGDFTRAAGYLHQGLAYFPGTP